jgi:hypothetical protein
MRGVIIGRDGASEIDAFGSMNNGATPDLQLMVGFWFNTRGRRLTMPYHERPSR